MPTVVVTIDCEAANVGRCYTKELVKVAEEHTVPMNWLIFVSEKDPLSNLDLYRNEFFHRIPSWHEVGLLVKFEDSHGYISDPVARAAVIRMAKDAIKSRHIKPTCFRSHGFDMLPDDIKALEDVGILVDASSCPAALNRHGVTGAAGPTQPYHPSYTDLAQVGEARLLIAPVSTYSGVSACLDFGWDRVKGVIEHAIDNDKVVHITASDTMDDVSALSNALALCKQHHSQFVTLTQLVTL